MEIRKRSALCESEDSETEPIERTMRVLNLTERLRVIEAGFRLSAQSDCTEQRAAATDGRRIIRMFPFCSLDPEVNET